MGSKIKDYVWYNLQMSTAYEYNKYVHGSHLLCFLLLGSSSFDISAVRALGM